MLKIEAREVLMINNLLDEIVQQFSSPENEDFLKQARTLASALPVVVKSQLDALRNEVLASDAILIRGFQIDDKKLGATPNQVGFEIDVMSGIRESFLLTLIGEYLGFVFGWSTQRKGALVNNILPLNGHTGEQLSTGSMVDLDWHTEEAFHDCRADYLALMCLRNHDEVPTTIASVRDLDLSESTIKILSQNRFIFLTDKNFTHKEVIKEAVLFGDLSDPYLRIDPSFMQVSNDDQEAKDALNEINNAINDQMFNVALIPGDILIIDNYKMVHGRKGFVPRFDGTDRWLKRVNITLDLRKSRYLRSKQSRIIITE